ncbi:MAG: LysE family translocator [Hellea sp.]
MTFATWTFFVGTVLLMMSTPGPSHLLMLSTSASNGFKRSLATAGGDLTANAIQMLLAGFGLAAILASSRYGFAIIKWGGVAYLVWIGIRTIKASFSNKGTTLEVGITSLKRLWLRGFITSAANPKAVVFFAALFPQFINPNVPLLSQILVLGATYIVIDGLFLSAYGSGASWLANRLQSHYKKWIDRVAGVSLVGAAALLGLKAVPQT